MLSAYDHKLEYWQGILNGNADALSRLPLECEYDEESQQVLGVHMMELCHAPVTEEEVRAATAEDEVLSKVLKGVSEGWTSELLSKEDLKPYTTRE